MTRALRMQIGLRCAPVSVPQRTGGTTPAEVVGVAPPVIVSLSVVQTPVVVTGRSVTAVVKSRRI